MSDEYLEEIRRSVRVWTRSPTKRDPAIARTRVLADLGERSGSPVLRWAAAAVTIIGLAAALVYLAPPSSSDRAVETTSVTASTAPRRSMVVYELSSGTKLYLTLSEPATATPAGGQGEGT